MTQDDWLFSLSKIAWKTVADKDLEDREYPIEPNISQLEDDERQKVIEKMKNYWKEHKSSSLEFLVNDAIVNCDKGSIMSRVKGKDHGVYTDKYGRQAFLNEDDRKLKTTDHIVFGCCSLEDKEDNKCKAKKFTKWYGVNSKVYIGEGKSSLIMSSYMICPYHKNAYIKPVTSGQEFTFTDSLFEYPKFVVERGEKHAYFKMEYWNKYDFKRAEINMKVIRKLAIRNISILAQDIEGVNTKGYYERKWIEYLAKFIILCKDRKVLCNIINEFYDKADFTKFDVVGKSIFLENYDLLLQSAKDKFQSILIENGYSDKEEVTKAIENYFLLKILKCIKSYVVTNQQRTIRSINELAGSVRKYYGDGMDVEYWTIDSSRVIVPIHTYISEAKLTDNIVDLAELWEYFERERGSLFVEMLIINLAATAAIIAMPLVGEAFGVAALSSNSANIASVLWTVGGSFLGAKLESDESEKFERIRYKQARMSLFELLRQIRVYTVYSNQEKDASTFSYEVYQSDETEALVNNFLNNISRIYVKVEKESVYRRSIIDILQLEEVVDKPLMIKINALIAALTLETISDMTIFGLKAEQNRKITGVDMLSMLYEFKIDQKDPYWVEIDRGDDKIAITEDNKVYFSQLFKGIV
ncbi:hypothetical protein HMPREF0491_02931 [Lachnospiraceae oral taxon 107 str. F0167]|nr:hypothetical protein HMPREF0491_02931 [Lachnospiraceae oral taxon 107 str. F0167]